MREPPPAGLDTAIAYLLRAERVSGRNLAYLFETNAKHIYVLAHRGAQVAAKEVAYPFLRVPLSLPSGFQDPVSPSLRQRLGVRLHEDSVVLDASEKRRLADLELRVESAAANFWPGVRYEQGLGRFKDFMQEIGYPARHERIRLWARLHQLLCETHVHSGRSSSAITEGLTSLHLYRVAQQESGWKSDLALIGLCARLISQAYLLRREPKEALHYLKIHELACAAAGVKVRPEYHHQLGTVAFQLEDYEAARPHYEIAARELAETEDHGRPRREREVLDIGKRHLILLQPIDWGDATAFFAGMKKDWPAGDIHVSIGLNWTAACGFCTDSRSVQVQADELLHEHQDAAAGYGQQATAYRLLTLTTRLPARLRRKWARHVLYENAVRDL